MLRLFGGSASAVSVVDFVMKIRKPEPKLAKLLISDLVGRDPRLHLNEDTVELVGDGFEARVLTETDFVVFDLETTGTKIPPGRVTEIGAFRVRNGRLAEGFQTLVNPETPIPRFITGLTGISDEMVRGAPKFSDIAAEFLDFIGDSVLVAHNAPFDMRFLNHEIGMIFEDYRVANPCLCTVKLSRKLLPDIMNHKLKTVAEFYSIDLFNHHRASDDARATAQIFVNLLLRLDADGIRDLAAIKRLGSRKNVYVR